MKHTPADVQVMAACILGQHNGASKLECIIAAILAERERCADVATKEGDGYRDNNLPLCAMGAYQVSKSILSGAS